MELRKLRPKEVVVGMICDMCGQNCAKDPDQPDFAYESGTLSASWGYYSNGRDLTVEECHLCEDCFGKVRDFITGQGGKVREIKASDFSNGPNYRRKKGVDYKQLPSEDE